MMIALLVGFGLTIANFAYQGCTDKYWMLAFDRSFFQVTACLVMALVDYSIRWRLGVA